MSKKREYFKVEKEPMAQHSVKITKQQMADYEKLCKKMGIKKGPATRIALEKEYPSVFKRGD